MVDALCGVVELAGWFTAIPGFEHDLFEGHLLHVGALDLVVEVGDVSGMMFSPVVLECFLFCF